MKRLVWYMAVALQVSLLTAGWPVHAGELDERLMNAADFGQVEVVRDLIEKGANVNWKKQAGETALMKAAHGGHADVVRILIEKGADVNADDMSGETALLAAALYGHTDVVRMLIEKGADVNAKDNTGGTALMRACGEHPHPDIVRMLIEKGANVNVKDSGGRTALDQALFMRGVGKEDFGYGPQQEKEIGEIVRMLQKAGARAE